VLSVGVAQVSLVTVVAYHVSTTRGTSHVSALTTTITGMS
jgi:hypothetical protein